MKKYIEVFKQTFREFGEDKAPRLGAALAYYTIFSIAPLLMIAISVAGLAFGDEAARGKISAQLGGIMGPKTAVMIEEMVRASNDQKSGLIAGIVGIVTLLFGASGVFAQLRDALDTIWNVEPKKTAGIMGFIKDRFLSMAMVFGVGFLLLVTLIFDAAISAMGDVIGPRIPGGEPLMHSVQLVVSFVLVTVLFAAMFRFLPHIKVAWRDVFFGATFTSLLFVIGKFALGLYIGKTAADSSYGAAGSLVVLLLWVYWSSQILFLGAEFTQVYARTYGSLKGDTSKRDSRVAAEQTPGATRVEDRPRTQTDAQGRPISPAPAYAKSQPATAKKKGGGGLVKVAAGGVAGLIFGMLFGVITAIGLVLKSIRKLIPIK